MTTHILTIAELDDFEAEHIAQILHSYKTDMLTWKIEAIVEDHTDGGSRADWFDEHLRWHDEIMTKVKWSKK